MKDSGIIDLPLKELLKLHPYVWDFLVGLHLEGLDQSLSISEGLATVPSEYMEDFGYDHQGFIQHVLSFIDEVEGETLSDSDWIESLEVIGGQNKFKEAEDVGFQLKRGEVLSIVGPTGAGKSRLLADIETLAQKDTPTMRQVLINGKPVEEELRFDVGNRFIAQLSQNMNFVMDVNVENFLTIHAESRMIEDPQKIVREIFECANQLAGEKFTMETNITELSGGQSRALMIADTALLSQSPVVLIDELENAGIDRYEALNLLTGQNKMVLMSTHDPLLALMADRRVVIKDGGIRCVIDTMQKETMNLDFLEKLELGLTSLREAIRSGETLDEDVSLRFIGLFQEKLSK